MPFKANRQANQISLRIASPDFEVCQKLKTAGLKNIRQMGIPYQTLISGIIHRYIEGDLVSKDS